MQVAVFSSTIRYSTSKSANANDQNSNSKHSNSTLHPVQNFKHKLSTTNKQIPFSKFATGPTYLMTCISKFSCYPFMWSTEKWQLLNITLLSKTRIGKLYSEMWSKQGIQHQSSDTTYQTQVTAMQPKCANGINCKFQVISLASSLSAC